jgi:hypothetical protein
MVKLFVSLGRRRKSKNVSREQLFTSNYLLIVISARRKDSKVMQERSISCNFSHSNEQYSKDNFFKYPDSS